VVAAVVVTEEDVTVAAEVVTTIMAQAVAEVVAEDVAGTPGVAPAIPRKGIRIEAAHLKIGEVADTVVAVVPTVLEAMTTAVTKIFTNVLRKSKKFRRLISCTKQKASTTTSTHKIQFYFYYFESTTITKKSNEKQKSTRCIIQK